MTTAVFDNESFNESLNETQSSQQLTDLHRANLHLSNAHLDALEEETIFILREVAAAFERPALLFWR